MDCIGLYIDICFVFGAGISQWYYYFLCASVPPPEPLVSCVPEIVRLQAMSSFSCVFIYLQVLFDALTVFCEFCLA